LTNDESDTDKKDTEENIMGPLNDNAET